jgi:hypothetical protein
VIFEEGHKRPTVGCGLLSFTVVDDRKDIHDVVSPVSGLNVIEREQKGIGGVSPREFIVYILEDVFR